MNEPIIIALIGALGKYFSEKIEKYNLFVICINFMILYWLSANINKKGK